MVANGRGLEKNTADASATLHDFHTGPAGTPDLPELHNK